MNGNDFITELSRQIEAIHYMGQCGTAWATTYSDYDRCEKKLIEFIKKNKLNIMDCMDCIYHIDYNWYSLDKIVDDIIECVEVGDYPEALNILNKHNTVWKYRHKLESIKITIF